MNQHDLMTATLINAGGALVEAIAPVGYTGKIADVFFEPEAVIVEVKSITTDRALDDEIQSKLGAELTKNAAKFGGPVIFGDVNIPVHQLPPPLAAMVLRIIGNRIQKEVKAANRQIRETKVALGLPDARGCLAFISPPFTSNPSVVGWLVDDALRDGKCSSIDTIITGRTPLQAEMRSYADLNSYLSFHGRHGYELPMQLKKRVAEQWAKLHNQPSAEMSEADFFDRFPQSKATPIET